MFRAIKGSLGRNLEGAIDVSSYGTDYRCFSPFTYSQDFRIPVPGQVDMTSHSVEGIWQGLKIIDGQTDFSLFSRKPKKREGEIQGHLLGNETLGLTEARKRIYGPSYNFYLGSYVPAEKKEEIVLRALESGLVTFYDTCENLDIQAPESLSHSVFLINFFIDYFNQSVKRVKKQVDSFYDKPEFEKETLAEPLARVIAWNQTASNLDQRLLKHFLENQVFSGSKVDSFRGRYYREVLKRLKKD